MYNGTFLTNLQDLSLPVCNMKYSYNKCSDNIHIRNVHVDTIKVYHSPTNAPVSCLKNHIKIYIKTAPTCFGAVTPSSGISLSVLAKQARIMSSLKMV